ncbi:MAG: acetate--CoA ligase family protein, partial [Rickettsiales bacterium]|nr:acetate--CoA ligase family protein [Rickettsiales bacterium]
APEVDTVFTIFGPTSITSSLDVAERLVEVVKRHNFKNLYFGWTGGDFVAAGREFLHGSNLPVCSAPEDGVEAFMGLIRSHEISDRIKGGILPLSRSKEKKEKGYAAAKKIIDVAAKAGRSTLTEAEAKAVFGLYGVPTVETFVAKTPKEAGRYALENIRGKVAIKIASEEISHKSDVGGVMLSLAPEEVEAAAGAMISGVRAKVGPKVKIQGVSVQEMIDKSEMFELLVGTTRNPVFGPAMVFGTGGKAVEVEKDSAMEFIPLDDKLAMEMVQRTRIYNKLKGFRDVKPVDFKMLSKIIVAVSDMMLDFPEIKELDINPVLADSKRIIAVDARIILDLESKDNKKGSKK